MPQKAGSKTRKRKGKELDLVQEDLEPEKSAKLKHQPIDTDLPGDGQFYCIECSRYFIDDATLAKHCKTKIHKRRLKELKVPAYTQAEADVAAGLGER